MLIAALTLLAAFSPPITTPACAPGAAAVTTFRATSNLLHRASAKMCAHTSSSSGAKALHGRELHSRIAAAIESDASSAFGKSLKRALGVMRDAFRLYGPDRVVASFNGGKDAVVILHLALAALAAHNEATGGSARLRVIFFEMPDEFPEIDAFVRDTVAQYDLELVTCANVGFADGLRLCIEEHNSAAFVLGTRYSDPNAGGQQDFAPSSDWMPPFMRVNPILSWSYADVWV